jgi:hypothetical protein
VNVRAYKFGDVLKLDTSYRSLADRIQDTKLKEIAVTYSNNMERVRSNSLVPILFVNGSFHHFDAFNKSIEIITKSSIESADIILSEESDAPLIPPSPPSPMPPEDWEDDPKFAAMVEESRKSHYESSIRHYDHVMEMKERSIKSKEQSQQTLDRLAQLEREISGDSAIYGFEKSDAFVERMLGILGAGRDEFLRGLDATLTGMVVGAWTAYETLAGDLWVAALNLHPEGLSDLGGKLTPSIKDSIRRAEKQQDEPRSDEETSPESTRDDNVKGKSINIPIRFLQKTHYNLSKDMGNILKSRYEFSKMSSLREAYALAFAKDRDSVINAVIDPCLDALNGVRNVIVHKAGKVDERFRKSVPGDPRFAVMKDDDELLLDGALVESLISPAVKVAVDLIKSVDDWLIKN